jgi:hypothetical protein
VPVIKSVSSNVEYNKNKSVFTRLGKLKDEQIKFHIDEKIMASAEHVRRIPLHVREKVERKIKRL